MFSQKYNRLRKLLEKFITFYKAETIDDRRLKVCFLLQVKLSKIEYMYLHYIVSGVYTQNTAHRMLQKQPK